jgi:hypothetical protein
LVADLNDLAGETAGQPVSPERRHSHFPFVIPAKAGIQSMRRPTYPWIPAFAGMTKTGYVWNPRRTAISSPRHAGDFPLSYIAPPR